jgi:mono/diheme cytochrome c family protein
MRSAAVLLLAVAAWAQSPKYGVGRTPTPEEVKQWTITPNPSGKGLPEGRGTAAEGREIYANRCKKCHGAKGEGAESVALVGGQGSLTSAKPVKTVGSYWPYATTVFDYIRRAMPYDKPGTLSNDQVYALTGFVLFLNGVVQETTVIDAGSLPKVQMPNRDGFVKDSRPDVKKR